VYRINVPDLNIQYLFSKSNNNLKEQDKCIYKDTHGRGECKKVLFASINRQFNST